ncbi:MAG: cob(I)yrinic acid a,c-diamide adenosyltransferase [Pseudomonadota bacterium]
MVVLNKIYTKTGDDGTTALGTGERRLKFDLRVESYGTVDETNSAVGAARLYTESIPDLHTMLLRMQNDLFDLGADLATPEGPEKPEYEPLRLIESQVERIESDIDTLNSELSPLRSFILPGGSAAATFLHVARTTARRAERLIVHLAETPGEHVNPSGIRYMNRVSDFLFVAARFANEKGANDILWVPGENR